MESNDNCTRILQSDRDYDFSSAASVIHYGENQGSAKRAITFSLRKGICQGPFGPLLNGNYSDLQPFPGTNHLHVGEHSIKKIVTAGYYVRIGRTIAPDAK